MNLSIQLKHFAFLTNECLHLAQETVNWSFNFVICIWFHFIRISQTSDLIWSDYPIHLISFYQIPPASGFILQIIPYIWFHLIRYPLHLVSFDQNIPYIWFHLIRIFPTSGFIKSEYPLHLVSFDQNISYIWFYFIRISPSSGFIWSDYSIYLVWFEQNKAYIGVRKFNSSFPKQDLDLCRDASNSN